MATPDRFPLPQVPDSSRKPDWLKVRLPHGDGYERVKAIVRRTKLATVCEEARCPNIAECWGDRKSTRLNSSHGYISYAVFCLKKKTSKKQHTRSCPTR